MEELRQEYKLKRTQFFVEANGFERHTLWRENDEGYYGGRKLEWEQDSEGCMVLVGEINSGSEKLPVYVDLTFAKIGGKYICFYYGCSRGIDHDLIEKFIEKYPCKWDKGSRRAMTDSNNFHHCIDFIVNE